MPRDKVDFFNKAAIAFILMILLVLAVYSFLR